MTKKKLKNVKKEIVINTIVNGETSFKKEIISPLILVGLILIFLAPMLFLWEGVCADDASFQSFPKKMAVARAFQQGEIPFWDYHQFCGGKPFYIMLENPVYNIFFVPFYFMANLNDYDQSFYVLYILPLSLLVVIAGLGAYYLSRLYFKFDYLISIIIGFLWAVNPSMALSTYSTINTTVFALIPWIVLFLGSFLETKRWYWWVLGAVSISIFNTAYTVNYPVRIYFTFFIIFGVLSIWHIMRDWKNIFTVGLTLLSVVFGFLLSAFVWVHILEAAKYSTEQFKLTYDNIVDFIPNSMPPTHLITMFIPNFNGSLDNFHAWGDGLLIYSADRNLTGGIFTSFALIISFAVVIFYKEWSLELDKKSKMWILLCIGVNLGTLLVMMGRYTPFYYLMCKLIPWIFLIPYPFYFHFSHHFAALILIGFGLNFLFEKYRKELINKINNSFPFYYIGFIALFAVVYLLSPVPSTKIQAYKFLSRFNEWAWFFTHPFLYFVLAAVLFIYIFLNRKKSFFVYKNIILIAIFIETFYIGYLGFYKNIIMPRPYERNNYEKLQRPHYSLPGKNPYYSQIEELKKIAEKDVRWASDVTSTDGMSWMVNGRTLAGYDSKPIISNTRLAIREFYKNFPYQLTTCGFPKMLLSNLNVGALVVYNSLEGENKIYSYNRHGVDYYLIREPEVYEKYGVGEEWSDYYFDKSFNGPEFKVHYIEKPMPYLYFQNKIFVTTSAQQKISLLNEDLRGYALLGSEALKYNNSILTLPESAKDKERVANKKEEFEALQKENIIIKEKRKYNSLTLLVDVKMPILLVRNESNHPDWKVFVDGKEDKIYLTNFMMQGVFLKEGKHTVVFEFFPKRLKVAFIIAVSSLTLLLLFILFMILKSYFKKVKIKKEG